MRDTIHQNNSKYKYSDYPETCVRVSHINRNMSVTKSTHVENAIEIPILYEDGDFLIIDKPAGLVVHPDGKTKEYALTDWIHQTHPSVQGVGEPYKTASGETVDRPGIVHRLDRETSGVLVIAKNQESYEFLKKSFQTRQVKKTYHTIVWGLVKDDTGLIERPIGRSKSDFRKWSAERFARGEPRPAVTEYSVIARKVFDPNNLPFQLNQKKGSAIPSQFSYVEVYPHTGRTHQIRVHFKAINHPVVADSLYAENHPKTLDFERLALHSKSISFTNREGKPILVEAPLPEDFNKAIQWFDVKRV